MLMTSTEVGIYLGINTTSTSSTTVAQTALIDIFIPVVLKDIYAYTNDNFISSYRYVYDDDFSVKSSDKTITVSADSTISWDDYFKAADTLFISGFWFEENNGFHTVSTRTSSVLTLAETLVAEESTFYVTYPKIQRCFFPENIKQIAAKMVWYNVNNASQTAGDIASESMGGYSVSYRANAGAGGYSIYPQSLLSGLKRVVKAW